MKVRVGYGLGTAIAMNDHERYARFIDALEVNRFDSLWLSDQVSGNCPDPLIAMAFAAARTTRLKVGTSVLVVPGRNPVTMAKALASLDQLSAGRLLLAFGLGAPNRIEHQAFGVAKTDRGGWFNEAVPIMRALWTGDPITHHGKRFDFTDVTVRPRPYQRPLEIWLGGEAPLELERVARLGDGWLPSFCMPDQVAAGRAVIEDAAVQHGRHIDPEHFGAMIMYRPDGEPVSDHLVRRAAIRRPGVDPTALIPERHALPAAIESFLTVGFSKFVLVPVTEPPDWEPELEAVAALVRPLET